MLRWCATHWRPASIFLRLCSRNDFASPSANLLRAPCNPTATTPIFLSRFFDSFYSIVFQHCLLSSLVVTLYDCLLLRWQFLSILSDVYIYIYFFLNFFHLDRFGLSIFNFLYFSLGILFCIPATLSGWSVLCTISGKNIRSSHYKEIYSKIFY